MFHWQGQQCHDSQTCGEWTQDQCFFVGHCGADSKLLNYSSVAGCCGANSGSTLLCGADFELLNTWFVWRCEADSKLLTTYLVVGHCGADSQDWWSLWSGLQIFEYLVVGLCGAVLNYLVVGCYGADSKVLVTCWTLKICTIWGTWDLRGTMYLKMNSARKNSGCFIRDGKRSVFWEMARHKIYRTDGVAQGWY